MHQGPSPSRSPSAQELCKVTVLVPMDCVERIRQFAQKLRAQQHVEPVPARPEWQTISPSVELVISRDCSARCAVRDTRAAGEDRFRWTVAVLGQLDPVAEGRAKDRAEARLQAETAAAAYFADWAELPGGGTVRDDYSAISAPPLLAGGRRTRLSPNPCETAHPGAAGRSPAGDSCRSTVRTRADGKFTINR